MLFNLRYALRILAKNPGFTAVAVTTLALGIGANTAIFSVIHALVLKPLPYREPDRLMAIDLASANRQGGGFQQFPWSYPMFEELRRENRLFESVAGFSNLEVNLTGTEIPERLNAELVSAVYFPMLGTQAQLGRTFRPEEDRDQGAGAPALIGYDLWQRKFAADAGVIGHTIHLNQIPYTVLGVMPRGFRGQSGDIDVWVPITTAPALGHMPKRLTNARNYWLFVIARLRPGRSLSQVRTQMPLLSANLERAYPSPKMLGGWQVTVKSLAEAKTDPTVRRSLLILFGAVGFVLLIACANLVNLLLSRSVARQKEVAVRLAIGAGRRALVAQLLTESVVLGLLGGLVGLLVANQTIDLLSVLRPEASEGFWTKFARAIPAESIQLELPVLAFNLVVSILAGIVFGLLPAIQASRLDLNQTLKNITSGWPAGWHSLRKFNARSALIAGEMAFSLILLAGAGLLLESFARLMETHLGADTSHILTASVDLPPQKYSPGAAVRFDEQLLDRMAGVPGIQAASLSNTVPARGQNDVTVMELPAGKGFQVVGVHSVSDDYFKLFRIPRLAGRLFEARDRMGAQKAVVVNEYAARRLWPHESPIGKRVLLPVWDPGQQQAEIVGVVGDVRYAGVEKPVEADVYVSFRQYPEARTVLIRTAGDPMTAAPIVRQAVHALDKDLPVYHVTTMDQQLAGATSRTRFNAVLLGMFAALALVLASVGIYGVVAHSVAARTREIGIRMALGADTCDVRRLVVGDGLLVALAGIAAGIPAALAATRLLTSFLYDTRPGDPLTFVAASLVLAAVAALASYIPARRATKIDPLVALRYE
ncbi:MAG TPA: ABC transporter permease [Bryobacteraceae bacterium]|nr:ABC transporter permease [Bryobacteraceae bacterium]